MLSLPKQLLRADILFAGILICLIGLLVLPLPTWTLDILLAANLAWAVVLLLIALYIPHPLRLSTFPSILLVATLFRLGLNVSSTRLILGQAEAGQVIEAFGNFVVRGNYVVGAVVFLILTLIQFLVIAKGAERVAEVAARFTLDAMPGRQMAIDADLRAGAFGIDEARERRDRLQAESHLFGSLDGAMKFVKGDAIAGMLITAINVVGGLLVGLTQQGMSAGEAAATYTLLTVGDGLVSQIPALLVTLSAGLLVTRVAAREDAPRDLGSEIISQVLAEPRVFAIASVLLLGLALVPGLPVVPFGVLAAAAFATSRFIISSQRKKERLASTSDEEPEQGEEQRQASLFEPVAPVLVEVGTVLGQAMQHDAEVALRDEIALVRKGLYHRLGVRLPSVRVRFDAAHLAPDHARVQVWELEEHPFSLPTDRTLVLAPPRQLIAHGINASLTAHPLGRGEASLIAHEHAAQADSAGFVTCTPLRHLMLRVAAQIEEHAASFIGLAEVQAALDALEATHGALVESVVPRPVTLSRLTGVLRRLVEDGVSIRDLRAILEALAAEAREEHDIIELTEIARVGLGRRTVREYAGSGALAAWIVEAPIEDTIRRAVRKDGDRPILALSPSSTDALLDAFRRVLPSSGEPVLLTSQDVRRYVQQLVRLERPGARVLGLREVAGHASITALGRIDHAGQAPPSFEDPAAA